MKKYILLFFISFILLNTLEAQEQRVFIKNVGVQINPYLKTSDDKGWNFTLRYNRVLFNSFSLGTELFINTYDNPAYYRKSYGVSLFGRYTFMQPKLNYFIEVHTWAAYGKWEHKAYLPEYATNDPYLMNSGNFYQYLNYFIAPGIEIPTSNKRFSLDLMLKLSTQNVVFDSWNIAPTFRINLHYKQKSK